MATNRAFAAYPANGYQYSDFAGAGVPGRYGFSGARGSAPSAVSNAIPSQLRQHHIIALVLVLVIGYGIFHITARMPRR